MYPSIHLAIYGSLYLFILISIDLSVYLSIYLCHKYLFLLNVHLRARTTNPSFFLSKFPMNRFPSWGDIYIFGTGSYFSRTSIFQLFSVGSKKEQKWLDPKKLRTRIFFGTMKLFVSEFGSFSLEIQVFFLWCDFGF